MIENWTIDRRNTITVQHTKEEKGRKQKQQHPTREENSRQLTRKLRVRRVFNTDLRLEIVNILFLLLLYCLSLKLSEWMCMCVKIVLEIAFFTFNRQAPLTQSTRKTSDRYSSNWTHTRHWEHQPKSVYIAKYTTSNKKKKKKHHPRNTYIHDRTRTRANKQKLQAFLSRPQAIKINQNRKANNNNNTRYRTLNLRTIHFQWKDI